MHAIVAAFFFYTPPLNYFALTTLSTVVVWSLATTLSGRKKWASVIVATLLQLVIQQIAYHAWVSGQSSIWWPLVQFSALQYLMALRMLNPSGEA